MSVWLLCLLAGIEAVIAWSFFHEGRPGMGLIWVCYTVSNFGFMLEKFK